MRFLLGNIAVYFPNARVVVTGYYPIVSPESDVRLLDGLLIAVGVPIGALLVHLSRMRLVDRSTLFHDEATSALRAAVADVNRAYGGKDFRFADPGFGAHNAYGAAESWLWHAVADDQVRAEREAACDARQSRMTLDESVICRGASAGHPNVEGARAYAAAITRELETLIPAC